MSALNIIQDLLEKENGIFIEHFARLGVISKVSEMVGPLLDEEDEEGNEDDTDGAASCQGEKVCSGQTSQGGYSPVFRFEIMALT